MKAILKKKYNVELIERSVYRIEVQATNEREAGNIGSNIIQKSREPHKSDYMKDNDIDVIVFPQYSL